MNGSSLKKWIAQRERVAERERRRKREALETLEERLQAGLDAIAFYSQIHGWPEGLPFALRLPILN